MNIVLNISFFVQQNKESQIGLNSLSINYKHASLLISH